MLKLSELKFGDLVLVTEEGVTREGVVTEVNNTDHKAHIDNGVQEFWYSKENISGIPLTDDVMMKKLGFEKEVHDGMVKYKKDAFRLVIKDNYDFTKIDLWYREDRRSFHSSLMAHTLQNLYLDMTKVHLEPVGMIHD